MKELTKAEEQVMHYLWELEKGFLKDIVEKFPEPKPANTTVSTVIRVLAKKGYINYITYGKSNEYFPLVGKEDYIRRHIKGVVNSFFSGSVGRFASFFTNSENLDLTELEEMKGLIENKINLLKKKND